MTGYLNKNQIAYVLFHLNQHVALNKDLEDRFVFVKEAEESGPYTGRILFILTNQSPILVNPRFIEDQPMVYPVIDSQSLYSIDNGENLVFHFDVLKSIFFLLSGFQEFNNNTSRDLLGRFNYTDSIQHKLEFTDKPIVNYYLETILRGFKEFGKRHGLAIRRKTLFSNFGFMLTHDIDSIDLYTTKFILYKIKELTGLVKTSLGFKRNFKLLLKGVRAYLGAGSNKNPNWNFEFMRELEHAHGFRSVFYFLEKDVPNSDSDYSFDEKRLVNLYKVLLAQECEVGLHGSVRTIDSLQLMQKSKSRLEKASESSLIGIRQHRLLWKHPDTGLIQEKAGFKYDTTLGFAAHEGFRNSYSYPFKLYDFNHDRISDIWEFPMNIMDVTLFAYQGYSMKEANERCIKLIREIMKFGGLFTLLWHNSFFDEVSYPGVTNFYRSLLMEIASLNPQNVTGKEMITILENNRG